MDVDPEPLLHIFIGFSLRALFEMNVDRYLAIYPITHRTSMTKGKLLAFFTFLVIIELTSSAMSINDGYFHPSHVVYQLQIVYSRQESRRNNEIDLR